MADHSFRLPPMPIPGDDFAELAAQFLDGLATEEEARRLDAMLQADEDKRRYFAGICLQSQIIRDVLESPAADIEFRDNSVFLEALDQERVARIRREAEAALQKQQSDDREAERYESYTRLMTLSKPTDQPQTRHYVIPKPLFYGGIAATVTFIVVTLWSIFGSQNSTLPEQGPVELSSMIVASLETSVGAKWAGNASIGDGQLMEKGDYVLSSGLAKITYESGAEMIIQGPARFSLDSKHEVTLSQGKLTGLCTTDQSRGFTVHTSSARIVDRGTEFGVSRNEIGEVQTHVFEGVVDVATVVNGKVTDRQPTRLIKNEAAIVSPSGTSLTLKTADSLAFVRDDEFEVNKKAEESPYHRWLAYTYDLRRDPALVTHYDFEDQNESDSNAVRNLAVADLQSRWDGRMGSHADTRILPTIAVGRWGGNTRSLSFDLNNKSIVELPTAKELGISRAMTVAAWIRLEDPQIYSLILTQWKDNDIQRDQRKYAFHFAVLGDPKVEEHGENMAGLGVLLSRDGNGVDIEVAASQQANSDNILIERGWVFVAFTFEIGQPVRIFQDGRVVAQGEIVQQFPLAFSDKPMVIGGKNMPSGSLYFNGQMDEILIFKRALLPNEIENLYMKSKPDAEPSD